MTKVDRYELISDSDPRLHRFIPYEKDPVGFVREHQDVFLKLFVQMWEWNGIGLAAPQVGLENRFFLIQHESNPTLFGRMVCVNPEIVRVSSEHTVIKEGCLSYPDQYRRIGRPQRIRVRYIGQDGQNHEHSLDGILARCFLHELDHLDGIVMFDRPEVP